MAWTEGSGIGPVRDEDNVMVTREAVPQSGVVDRPRNTNPNVGVEIVKGEQPWATIWLADGNRLRIQLVIMNIYRNDAERDPAGMPGYVVQAHFNTQAFPPEEPVQMVTQHWPKCTALQTGKPEDCDCPHGAR